jgi:hypothetical protein
MCPPCRKTFGKDWRMSRQSPPTQAVEQATAGLAVDREMDRQEDKWGIQNHHDLVWLGILGEEFGELCKALNEGDIEGVLKELTQTTAVGMSWLACKYRLGAANMEVERAEEEG